ncbi:hypothetical protein F4825DRAFT_238686 [Nemania diffusa]|nr:hypothetical protein F4825DRAFT_238686 [Nemania diffusa]
MLQRLCNTTMGALFLVGGQGGISTHYLSVSLGLAKYILILSTYVARVVKSTLRVSNINDTKTLNSNTFMQQLGLPWEVSQVFIRGFCLVGSFYGLHICLSVSSPYLPNLDLQGMFNIRLGVKLDDDRRALSLGFTYSDDWTIYILFSFPASSLWCLYLECLE